MQRECTTSLSIRTIRTANWDPCQREVQCFRHSNFGHYANEYRESITSNRDKKTELPAHTGRQHRSQALMQDYDNYLDNQYSTTYRRNNTRIGFVLPGSETYNNIPVTNDSHRTRVHQDQNIPLEINNYPSLDLGFFKYFFQRLPNTFTNIP
jgi:hypothetical protein